MPESRALLVAALEETTAVARARGIHLPANQVEKTLERIDQAAPGIVASMQKDILEGRPSELEAQHGTVVLGHTCEAPVALVYAAFADPLELARLGSVVDFDLPGDPTAG